MDLPRIQLLFARFLFYAYFCKKYNYMSATIQQFDKALAECRRIYSLKLSDYSASWRLLRPASIADQILIKAKRIRTLELTGESKVGEGILPEFMAIVNYGIMALIQLEKGFADEVDIDSSQALKLYDKYMEQTRSLMIAKNHDYGEAWRMMRVSTYTDFILVKLQRIREIEANSGETLVSEGIDSNIMDIINYSVFGIIRLTSDDKQS